MTLFWIKTVIQPLYHTDIMASKLFELTKKLSVLKVNCLILLYAGSRLELPVFGPVENQSRECAVRHQMFSSKKDIT